MPGRITQSDINRMATDSVNVIDHYLDGPGSVARTLSVEAIRSNDDSAKAKAIQAVATIDALEAFRKFIQPRINAAYATMEELLQRAEQAERMVSELTTKGTTVTPETTARRQ